ncbi:MAG TPA: alpha/beta hydrolase [Acidimicrobiales bacterium]|nr:alpha/beta hydrolase [Acidimicrobiales bacterium]
MYDDDGAGPAVLFSHSWFCDGRQWPQAPAVVRAGYRVLNLDNRGHGRSGPHRERYTVWDMADDLVAVLDAAGETSAVLVGLSVGGFAALRAALRHPARVRALVLADTAAGPQSWPGRAKARALAPIFLTPARRVVMPTLLRTLFGPTARRTQPDLVAQWRERFARQDPASMASALDAIVRRDDVRSELSRIAVPTLVIVGEEDREPGVPASTALAARIPGAQFAVLPMTGHLSALESPRIFESRLLSFLAGVDAPASRFDSGDPTNPG